MAKAMPGPYMWPVIGAINYFACPQGEFSTMKLFHLTHESLYYNHASVPDKIYEVTTELFTKFRKGFVYWSFGHFIYNVYSADAIEVLLCTD